MSRRWRKGSTVGESMKMVVIGCSGCGALAGLTAKKQSPQLDVTIIREPDEKGLLTRCATPYICCGRALVDPSYKDDRIFGDAGVSLVDHRAVSRKGAQGLMQLMPDTADLMEVDDPFDPEENIFGGTRYLSLLLKRFRDDKTLALAAYNAGPEAVETHKGIPPFSETRTFVRRVLDYYRTYRTESR